MRRIYLDYNASTPIAPEVVEAMSRSLKENFGNPSSSHWAGKPARAALTEARQQVAALLGASPEEIVLTSGGSEANNHAIKGAFFALRWRGNHIVTTRVEHPSVIQPCRFLEALGLCRSAKLHALCSDKLPYYLERRRGLPSSK